MLDRHPVSTACDYCMDTVDVSSNFRGMLDVPFACRVCKCRQYVMVGKSRLGAKMYCCSQCSVVFMDPDKFSLQKHEQMLPNLGHNMIVGGNYGVKSR